MEHRLLTVVFSAPHYKHPTIAIPCLTDSDLEASYIAMKLVIINDKGRCCKDIYPVG